MKKSPTAKLLWHRNHLELWRTDTEYGIPKFHVLQRDEHIISTFNADEVIVAIKKIRQAENW